MRQRSINWAGAMRDMRRHRTPEQMLQREMLEALKLSRNLLRGHAGEAIDKIDATIAKAEARHG